MKRRYVFLLSIALGCGGVNSSTDAQIDVLQICDPMAKFGTPMPVPGLDMADAYAARLSSDELTIYSSRDPGDMWVAHRSAITGAFGPPMFLTAQNSPSLDFNPSVSTDGLMMWFESNRVANEGFHLYVATRASMLAEFGTPGLAATVNATDPKQTDWQPFVTADGKELWFTSSRAGGLGGIDIWHAASTSNGFATPANVPELNSSSDDDLPMLSADRLTVYFTSARAVTGTKGRLDIWRSHRSTVNDGFPAPVLVEELNTAGADVATWLSADNCRMYGFSDVSGRSRLFVATRQL